MEPMLTYCSSIDQSSESDNFFPFQPANLSFDSDFEMDHLDNHTHYNKQIASLVEQCNNYKTIIKRQEKEINDYRLHVESLEDEYCKIRNELINSESNLKLCRSKVTSYQDTISSLEDEIDLLNSKLISPNKNGSRLSFSNEYDFKIDNSGDDYDDIDLDIDTLNDILSHSIDGKMMNSLDRNKILIILKELCTKNSQLKIENEQLKKENSELRRENNDYKSIIYNPEEFSKNLENGKKSTPIKNSTEKKNFITYQALNIVENISYSNEDDECEFECENICVDKNYLKLNDSNGFTWNNTINYIENEEMPSRFVKDQSTQSNQKFSLDSTIKEIMNDVTSIEDEQMPETFASTTIVSEKESEVSTNEPQSIIYCENSNQNKPEMIIHSTSNNNQMKIFSIIIQSIFIIFILMIVYLGIFQTKIPPLYSAEEILFDILNQFCTKTRISTI